MRPATSPTVTARLILFMCLLNVDEQAAFVFESFVAHRAIYRAGLPTTDRELVLPRRMSTPQVEALMGLKRARGDDRGGQQTQESEATRTVYLRSQDRKHGRR